MTISKPNLPLLCIRALAVLPLSLRSVLGWLLGFVFGLLPLRDQRITRLQIRAVLGKSRVAALLLCARVFANAGRCFLESLQLRALLNSQAPSVTCQQLELIHTLLAQRRPIVALTAHLGNWELIAAYMVQLGVPLTAVGKQLRSPELQEALEFLRQRHGVETIWRSERASARGLLRALQRGRTVSALVDQDTTVASISLPFLGLPAATPIGLLELGLRVDAAFVSAFIVRTGFLRFEVQVQELPTSNNHEMLREFNRRLEQHVRAAPEQWVWFHKRWRSPEPGKRLSRCDYLAYLKARC